MTRPRAALAMFPWAAKHVVGPAERERLSRVVDLVDEAPLTTFDDERATGVLAEVELLLTCWGAPTIDDAVLALAPRLRAVVHAAGTVKGFVSPACWERGVRVTSVAAANAVPVAEYTLAVILLANKSAFTARERYRSTRTMPRPQPGDPVPGNLGKRIGIIGASRVGRRVVDLLQPFDLEVVLADPLLAAADAEAMGARLVALDDLLRTSDVVSLHAPLLPETTGLLGARELSLLRDGVTFVNTARGAIVDGEALEAELTSGRISAVIDTTWPEPPPPESPLYDLPNVFLTPHLAGSQGTELRRLADDAVAEVERYARGEAFAFEITASDLAWIA